MLIDALTVQGHSQPSLLSSLLLELSPVVLEPYLQLVLCDPQLSAKVGPPHLSEVLAGLELHPQPAQLLHGESSSLFLVLTGGGFLPLPVPCSSS